MWVPHHGHHAGRNGGSAKCQKREEIEILPQGLCCCLVTVILSYIFKVGLVRSLIDFCLGGNWFPVLVPSSLVSDSDGALVSVEEEYQLYNHPSKHSHLLTGLYLFKYK